jgi:hypothetical protein
MTITLVQGPYRGTGSRTDTITATFGATPTNGNLLIAVVACATGSIVTSGVAETNATWTKAVNSSYGTQDISIWYSYVTASNFGTAVTATIDTFGGGLGVINIFEYSGLVTSNVLDKTATQSIQKTTSPVTGTTATTSQTVELCIGGLCGSGATTVSTPINSFTLYDGVDYASVNNTSLAYIASATGTYSSGGTSFSNINFVGAIATFKGILPAESNIEWDNSTKKLSQVHGTHARLVFDDSTHRVEYYTVGTVPASHTIIVWDSSTKKLRTTVP